MAMKPYDVDWEKLRKACRQKQEGLSRRGVAASIVGISHSTYSRFLNGKPLDLETLLVVIGYSDLSVEQVIIRRSVQLDLL